MTIDWATVPVYLALGAVIGFLAGLLGIGGGMTIVPILTIVFTHERFPPEHVVHMAVATAVATILFTSIASTRAHHRRGAVLWSVVRDLAPGIVLGSLVGPQIAARLSSKALASVFCVVAALAAIQIARGAKPKPGRELPGRLGLASVGASAGIIASLVGAGGAFVIVPFMTWCNVRIHSAVATSAAIGMPIALCAAAGFVLAGHGQQGLPPYTFGYIYLPALAGIVVSSMLAAPLGARVAHGLPVQRLRLVFATLLFSLSGYMVYRVATT